jgi:phage terminase large subunit-like protein
LLSKVAEQEEIYSDPDAIKELARIKAGSGGKTISPSNVPDPHRPPSPGADKDLFAITRTYDDFFSELPSIEEVNGEYDRLIEEARDRNCEKNFYRHMGRTDRFFLLTRMMNRPDANTDWTFKRCRMVEKDEWRYLDTWSREHYKSTIISFAGSVQRPLKNPEITQCIFSFTRPIAKSFLSQVKIEYERNELLKWAYPDILHSDAAKTSRRGGYKWGLDDGICVKREGNPKEQTLEAWGMIDAQPTSKHFQVMTYNDVVTEDTVKSDLLIAKTTKGWQLSQNLGVTSLTGEPPTHNYEGTIFHYNETYHHIARTGLIQPRVFVATADGTLDGEPLLWTRETLLDKRATMGPYIFACQIMMNPRLMMTKSLDTDWLEYHNNQIDTDCMIKYIIVDPAKGKDKRHDYTALAVIGLAPDHNFYVLEWFRDKLSLSERTNLLFRMHAKWNPYQVHYEEYGMSTDIEHIQGEQKLRNFRFVIHPLKGRMSKDDRIERLIPDLEAHRWVIPYSCIRSSRDLGTMVDMTKMFIQEEYVTWPLGAHDDMLDDLARMYDVQLKWPKAGYSDQARVFKLNDANDDERGWDVLRHRGMKIDRPGRGRLWGDR